MAAGNVQSACIQQPQALLAASRSSPAPRGSACARSHAGQLQFGKRVKCRIDHQRNTERRDGARRAPCGAGQAKRAKRSQRAYLDYGTGAGADTRPQRGADLAREYRDPRHRPDHLPTGRGPPVDQAAGLPSYIAPGRWPSIQSAIRGSPSGGLQLASRVSAEGPYRLRPLPQLPPANQHLCPEHGRHRRQPATARSPNTS